MDSLISNKITLLNKTTLESYNSEGKTAIVKAFTEIGIKIFEASFGFACLREKEDKEFKLAYKSSGTPCEPNLPKKKGSNDTGQKERQPVFVSRVKAQNYGEGCDVSSFIKSYVIIPIFFDNFIYGNLVICYKVTHHFSAEEKGLSIALGSAAAQAITVNNLILKEQEARTEAEKQKRRFQAMIEHGYDVILLLNKEGIITEASNSAARVTGYSEPQLVGKKNLEFIHPDDACKMISTMEKILEQPGVSHTLEVRYKHADGSWRWLETNRINMLESPDVGGIVVNMRDITERKRAEKTILLQATRDPLTHLPNREEFRARFNQALEQAKRNSGQMALMFLDIDRLKIVNDRLGHDEGDRLLKVVASRLTSSLRAEDAASRFGGDEFLVLINETRSDKDAVVAAEKILKAVNLPVKIGNHTLYPSVSVGIAMYPNDGLNLDGLKKNADIALYRAKESGRNRFSLYDHSLDRLYKAEKFAQENELREALLLNQIGVFYQPIISLKKQKLVAVEALARWVHPKRGLVLPAEFITLAEETGLIAELDKIVLKQVCRQAKNWQDMGISKFRVAVNLSAQQFSEPDFVSGIAAVLAETNLGGDSLELEITETLTMNNLELTRQNLVALKKLGVHITIDDFGTGYSSLNYLKRFPIHGLKIDKAFIKNCIVSPQDTSIVKAIVAMAKALNLKVTAEGVEELQQLGFLSTLGCDSVQGFFIGKPMPAKDLPGWILAKYPEKPAVSALAENRIQVM
jgi:diguanylate cyclase (GGDEF)-like protein/PAS domain S-box-containing protein